VLKADKQRPGNLLLHSVPAWCAGTPWLTKAAAATSLPPIGGLDMPKKLREFVVVLAVCGCAILVGAQTDARPHGVAIEGNTETRLLQCSATLWD